MNEPKLSTATLEDIEFLRSYDGEDYRGVMDGLNRVIKYLIGSTHQLNGENAKELNEVLEHMRNIMWAEQFITNLSREE